eukprot:1964-Heterococcus_DN1.PRE.1
MLETTVPLDEMHSISNIAKPLDICLYQSLDDCAYLNSKMYLTVDDTDYTQFDLPSAYQL